MASARVFLMFALVAIVVMACQIEARTLRGIDIERTTATCAKWGGIVGGKKTCLACHDQHVLIPGGTECIHISKRWWGK
jgi:hypothetical protein